MTTLVDCPRTDRGQWTFRLFGAPVRVKFWFWITLLILSEGRDLIDVLIWMGVCFVSILLHEMGHVLAFRFFRRDAEIVLYGFGGLAIPRSDVNGCFPEVAVALAGPVAGFCLAGLALALTQATGGQIFLSWRMFLPHLSAVPSYRLLLWTRNAGIYTHLSVLLNDLLFVNFYWGLVNLLPVWPLDGGHVARALLEQWDLHDGYRKSLILSAVAGGAIALAGLGNQNLYLTLLFGIMAVSSLQLLESARSGRFQPYRRRRD